MSIFQKFSELNKPLASTINTLRIQIAHVDFSSYSLPFHSTYHG